MTRKYLISEERKRRIKEVDDKRKADERTADEALDGEYPAASKSTGPE